ncbi:hypothetical protein MMC22_008343 [Lobaria immixta]|nr:hypothetical protein [Lobaria immixta]
MCAARAGFPGNFKCECIGSTLVCGWSLRLGVQVLLRWCYRDCECGLTTHISLDARRTDLDRAPIWNFDYVSNDIVKKGDSFSPNPQTSPSGNHPTGNTRTCSGTCRSVDHGCNQASQGDCKCFAPPVSLLYWHQGDCGTRLPFKAKRDLAQQRHSYYLNLTNEFASSNKATAPPGPLPDHTVQLASGLLPSPCNVSYVSFACSDSPDGIVHEPPENWLGALVPEGAKKIPSVPMEFLRIHGGKKGNMQVLRPALD